jgi:NADPH-dependent 2,4-dienoyl-CoA reductase/sulfur reductase-like enzyme
MKVTRRHLIKMLSYAIPALTSPQMRAFMRGKTGVVPGGVTATIEVLQSSDAAALPDLLVYGGTSSGVMTAYSAAREGLRVVLLEAGAHLGGMVTGCRALTSATTRLLADMFATSILRRPLIMECAILIVWRTGTPSRIWGKIFFAAC